MSANPHYPYEAELLARAVLEGDVQAIDDVLSYLGSSNADLRHIMLACLHDAPDGVVWKQMLFCIASSGWEALPGSLELRHSGVVRRLQQHRQGEPIEPDAYRPLDVERVEQSIIEAFSLDQDENERSIKERILNQALHADSTRYAAAYLLALRNSIDMIPLLEEMIFLQPPHKGKKPQPETGIWARRAIRALAELQDERCGPPLVRALAMERGSLHQEARRAISDLGHLAEPALLEALHHTDPHIRWHAACGLNALGIKDVTTAPDMLDTLAAGLYDDSQQVRWATARALAQLDAAAVPAILRALVHHPLTEPFRQAVHHTLHSLPSQKTQARLQELIDVLHQPGGNIEAPAVAQRLLSIWS